MPRLALPCALVFSLVACAGSWRVDPAGPAATISERRPSAVRVTAFDSSRIEVTKPVLQGDSIVGSAYSPVTQGPRPVAIPLASVAKLEYRHSGGGGTGALIGLGLLGAVVIGMAAGGGPSGSY